MTIKVNSNFDQSWVKYSVNITLFQYKFYLYKIKLLILNCCLINFSFQSRLK